MSAKATQNEEQDIPTRDDIRAKIFSGGNRKSAIVTVFGVAVELKQPPLGEVLRAQEMDDKGVAMATLLTRYTYVPGTNEHVFEQADIESILSIPFGPEIVRLQEAVSDLMGINVRKEGNASSEQIGTTST